MFKWIKSFFAKPKPEPEGFTIVYFEDGYIGVPDSLPLKEIRRVRLFPTEVIDQLEANRNRVLH